MYFISVNIRNKILVDRIVGQPVAFALNLMARLIARPLKRNHNLQTDFKRIVVCKYVGMGSIIQLTPLLLTLKENYPHARIMFVTSKSNRELVAHIGLADRIIIVNDAGLASLFVSTLKALIELWQFRPELYLDFEIFSNFSGLVSTMSCALNRIGFFKSSFKSRSGMYNYLVYYNMKAPVSEVYLQMARLIGCKTIVHKLYKVSVSHDDRKKLENIFPLVNRDKYIIINPNASELRIERRWDGKAFAGLIEIMAKSRPELDIVLIGDQSETAYVAGVLDGIKHEYRKKITDITGKLTLGMLIALIDSAELLITNDTGPMHIAFSLGKRAVTLWGPCHPMQYGNFPDSFPIYKNIYCSPCIFEFEIPPCKGDNQCMKAISISEVKEAVDAALSGCVGRPANTGEMIYTRQDNHPLGIVVN